MKRLTVKDFFSPSYQFPTDLSWVCIESFDFRVSHRARASSNNTFLSVYSQIGVARVSAELTTPLSPPLLWHHRYLTLPSRLCTALHCSLSFSRSPPLSHTAHFLFSQTRWAGCTQVCAGQAFSLFEDISSLLLLSLTNRLSDQSYTDYECSSWEVLCFSYL